MPCSPTRRAFLAVSAASVRRAWGDPRFEQTDLFRKGDNGVHTYRIPALVEARKGVLIAVADARHDSARDLPARISLVIRRSRDGGRTWTEAQTLRTVSEGGVGDASLLLDRKTGRVWCFHNYGPPGIGFVEAKPGANTGPQTLQVHAIYSDDEGETWSRPVDLTPQIKDPAWQALFATSGTHFQTSRGRYLIPIVVRDTGGVVASHNAYSDDAGRSWKIGPSIGRDTNESKAVELADGGVLQNMRNVGRETTRSIARSHDSGVVFGPVTQDDALIDPSCNAGFARYRRGRHDLLFFTNPAAPKRRNLTVKLSLDGGVTWPKARTLHPGPAAYSTVIPLRDGTLGVLYERGEKESTELITFARFDLNWVDSAERR